MASPTRRARTPSGKTPKTTTHGIVARDAHVAVVLRRGPTRHVQLLRWDLRNDAVEPGQWLIGTVESGACALSPDGALLLYTARKGPRTFTAISRPPYFTALAFWEHQLPWSGGGFFVARDHVVMALTHAPDDGSIPRGLKVTDIWSYFPWSGNQRSPQSFGDAVLAAPEAHQGFQRSSDGWFRKVTPAKGGASTLERATRPGQPGAFRLAGRGGRDLGVLDWADWAPDGSLLSGRDGCLWRDDVVKKTSKPVADLRGHAFEHVVAPAEARRR